MRDKTVNSLGADFGHIVPHICNLQTICFCLKLRDLLSVYPNALHFSLNELFVPCLAYRSNFVVLRCKH